MKMYKYGMRLRGFSPACQPMDGLQGRLEGNEQYYDILLYDRRLTPEEIQDYSLDYLGG